MNINTLAGIVLLVVGIVLVYFGIRGTETFTEQVHETFTGRYTQTTMLYLIGGVASVVAGLLLIAVNVFSRTG